MPISGAFRQGNFRDGATWYEINHRAKRRLERLQNPFAENSPSNLLL